MWFLVFFWPAQEWAGYRHFFSMPPIYLFVLIKKAAWKIEQEYKDKVITHQLDFCIVDPTLMANSLGNWAQYAKSQSPYFTYSIIRPEALMFFVTLTQEDEALSCCQRASLQHCMVRTPRFRHERVTKKNRTRIVKGIDSWAPRTQMELGITYFHTLQMPKAQSKKK